MSARDVLTDWSVEGGLQCPDCGIYIDFSGSLSDLEKLVDGHVCEQEGLTT